MKTIARPILIAALLFIGCSPAAPDRAPASTSTSPDRTPVSTSTSPARTPVSALVELQSASRASPKRFWFDYQFEPFPGKRNWSLLHKDIWIEEYGSGVVSLYKVLGPETITGVSGTLVAKIIGDRQQTQTANDGTFQAFIPDVGSSRMRLGYRHFSGGKWGEWGFLGEMQGVE